MKKEKGDVNISGKFAAGRDININKLSNFSWLIVSLFVLTFMVLGWVYRDNLGAYLNKFDKFSPRDTQELKILLLPFKGLQDDAGFTVDYKEALVSSLAEKKKNDNLHIQLKAIEGIDSPNTDDEAKAIALDKNADLVIWGSYVESREGPIKLRLRYLLIKDFQVSYLNNRSSDKEEQLRDINSLKNGYLENDLHYLLNWIEGISAINQNDYKRALNNFRNIQNDSLLLQQYEFHPLNNLADIFLTLGREEFTFPIFHILQARLKEHPEKYTDAEKASLFSSWGIAHGYAGDINESVENHLKAIDIVNQSKENGKEFNLLKSGIYSSLGVQYVRMNKWDEAEECFKVCVKIDSALVQEGVNTYEMWNIINNLINLSELQTKKNELEEALKTLADAEQKAKNSLDTNDRLWGAIYNNKGEAYFHLGDYQQALHYQKKDVVLSQKIFDPFHRDLIPTYNNMAIYYEKLDSLEMSLLFQEKALKIAEHNDVKKMTNRLASIYSNYALNLADNNEFEKSIAYHQKSIDIRENRPDADTNPDLAASYNNMSYTYRKMKQYDKALIYHERAVAIATEIFGEEGLDTAVYYSKMAESYVGKKEYQSALEIIQRVDMAYQQHNIPESHPAYVSLMKLQEECLANLN
jgi:tetratricopeptide (TPR) repeat protein